MNCSFWGKTIENVRDRVELEFIKNVVMKKLLNKNQN